MIPEQNKEDVIQTGMSFMRAITEAYGTDEGMQLWDTIASTLDPDIKGQIFFAMLTGQYTKHITLSGHMPGADRVRLIKTIRNVDIRSIGLKDAKDMTDHLTAGKHIQLEVEPTQRVACINELRKAGFYV